MFKRNARLNPGQVRDMRGRRAMGGPVMAGGGIVGVVVTLIIMFMNMAGGGASSLGETNETQPQSNLANCQTGEDANLREECRIVGFVNSIQKFWTDEFSRRNANYTLAPTTLFTDATQSGCGYATSEMGPFYCPSDRSVYLDLGFFRELRTRFGAQGGPFAEAYVLAHEYGHHVQNLTGTLQSGDSDTGPQSTAVRVELQADCYAGVWANQAESTGFLEPVSDALIADALNAAAAVGDDRIQKSVQGRVNPESWTHGSSEQRQRWFTTGYRTGDMASCDTFKGTV